MQVNDDRTQRRPLRAGDADGTTWSLWPWLNWLLPALWCWLAFGAGWMYIGYVFAIVLYPLVGVAGMAPRMILRRRGAVGTPRPIAPLLILQWWAIGLPVVITVAQYLFAPVFEGLFGVREIAIGPRWAMLSGSAAVAVVAWIAALVLASTLTGPTRRDLLWRRIARVTAIAAPIAVLALLLGGLFATGQHRDAADATVAEVRRQPLHAQAERFEERYEQMNRAVSEVRGLIAEDDWSDDLTGLGDDGACSTTLAECYAFRARFSHEGAGADLDVGALRAQLDAEGWTLGDLRDYRSRIIGITATDSEGLTIGIRYDESDPRIEVTAETGAWWGDERVLLDELGGAAEGLREVRTYRFDEWPPLR